MKTLSPYYKLVVTCIGLLVMILQRHNIDLSGQEAAIADLVISALTAFGVYRVPNKTVIVR